MSSASFNAEARILDTLRSKLEELLFSFLGVGCLKLFISLLVVVPKSLTCMANVCMDLLAIKSRNFLSCTGLSMIILDISSRGISNTLSGVS